MLSNALALAVLTTAGFVILYKKLPRKIRKLIEKFSLASDLIALILVYTLLGGTLTALVAGALCGLFVSILLYIANNEEDFMLIYDLKDIIREKLKEARNLATRYGQQYKDYKEKQAAEALAESCSC